MTKHTPILAEAFTSGRICLTADEFTQRHSLNVQKFYSILQERLHAFPTICLIGDQYRFLDVDGASGLKFNPVANLEYAPPSDKSEVWVPVSAFCEMFGLTNDQIVRLRLRQQLPKAVLNTHFPGEVLLRAEDIQLWEMARHADLGRV